MPQALTIWPIFLALVLFGPTVSSQSYSRVKANKLYKKGFFREACDAYVQALDSTYDIESTLIRASDACFRCAEYERSWNLLDQIKKTQSNYDEDVNYYTARLHFINRRWKKAIAGYKAYLKAEDSGDLREAAKRELQWAWAGSLRSYKKSEVIVANAGSKINTDHDERYAVPSPSNPGRYYFSSAKEGATGGLRNAKGGKEKFYGTNAFDVYAADLTNGQWTLIEALSPLINTTANDAIIDISVDGQRMYSVKEVTPGEITVSVDTFSSSGFQSENRGRFTLRFGRDFDMVKDVIVFAAEMEEGYGGSDLYISVFDGSAWSKAKNLGPAVNSSFNEVSPHLTRNGEVLYFSSDRPESVGGYDVFTSKLVMGDWTSAESLMGSINSPANDLDFRLSMDGSMAMFSSNRVGGEGGYDIYVAYLEDQVIAQLETTDREAIKAWYSEEYIPVAVKVDREVDEKKEVKEVFVEPKELERYEIPVIFYDRTEQPVASQMRSALETLPALLTKHRTATAIVSSHTHRSGSQPRDLFVSSQRARKLKDDLVARGVNPGQVIVKAYGSQRSIVKDNVQGTPMDEQWSNRSTFRVIGVPAGEDVKYRKVEVPANLRSGERYDDLTGLNYRIILAQAEQMLTDPVLLGFGGLIIEQRGADAPRYMIEGLRTYAQTKEVREKLSASGLPSAEIVPYLGESPIPISKIKDLVLRYPDLSAYSQDQ